MRIALCAIKFARLRFSASCAAANCAPGVGRYGGNRCRCSCLDAAAILPRERRRLLLLRATVSATAALYKGSRRPAAHAGLWRSAKLILRRACGAFCRGVEQRRWSQCSVASVLLLRRHRRYKWRGPAKPTVYDKASRGGERNSLGLLRKARKGPRGRVAGAFQRFVRDGVSVNSAATRSTKSSHRGGPRVRKWTLLARTGSRRSTRVWSWAKYHAFDDM